MKVLAKFKCTSKQEYEGGYTNIELDAVSDNSEENKKFWEATPNGSMHLGTSNIEAAKQFVPGEEYFITIEAVKGDEPV